MSNILIVDDEKEAIIEAEKWVSVPGYSEHQISYSSLCLYILYAIL